MAVQASSIEGKMIHLGKLKIDPVALGSQGNAVLGIRGSGKTYTATLLAEMMHDHGILVLEDWVRDIA